MAAEAFRDWLPLVINEVDPWMSSADIKKGARWSAELADRLRDTEFALIFVTPENQLAPWLLFEAGALSESLAGSVATVLLDMESEDLISSPLGQFQDTKLRRDDVFRLLETINERVSLRLSETRLSKAFDMGWDRIEERVGEAWLTKAEPSELPHPEMPGDLAFSVDTTGNPQYRLRLAGWLEELVRAIKAPPRTVKALFRVTEEDLPELERLFANRACPAHPRFITIEKRAPADGHIAVEARACCRFALLVAHDQIRSLMR